MRSQPSAARATTDIAPQPSDLARDLARRLAPVLKALADENRLAILLAIAARAASVVTLTQELGMSQTLVSHHLKALRDNGLVTVTPYGRSNVYALCCDQLIDTVRQLEALAVPAGTPRAPRRK